MRPWLDRVRTLAVRTTFYPFTAATCTLLCIVGVLTLTATGRRLTQHTLQRFGWAPRDLIALDIGRTVFSAFVTNGGLVFWSALALTLVLVGAAEHLSSSVAAGVTFWGSHLATLGLMLLSAFLLHRSGLPAGRLIFITRDVGPSAGFVGCLGMALVSSESRWRWPLIATAWVALLAVLGASVRAAGSSPTDLSASLAHAIALPVGVAFGLAFSAWRGRTTSE